MTKEIFANEFIPLAEHDFSTLLELAIIAEEQLKTNPCLSYISVAKSILPEKKEIKLDKKTQAKLVAKYLMALSQEVSNKIKFNDSDFSFNVTMGLFVTKAQKAQMSEDIINDAFLLASIEIFETAQRAATLKQTPAKQRAN